MSLQTASADGSIDGCVIKHPEMTPRGRQVAGPAAPEFSGCPNAIICVFIKLSGLDVESSISQGTGAVRVGGIRSHLVQWAFSNSACDGHLLAYCPLFTVMVQLDVVVDQQRHLAPLNLAMSSGEH
mgnify:CR=1 FL=1